MALIFLYIIGVLATVKPLYFLFKSNLDLFNEVKNLEQAKEAAVVCAWFWILALPVVTIRVIYAKINIIIRKAI